MITVKTWIILLIIIVGLSLFLPASSSRTNTKFDVKLTILIYDVFPTNRTAEVEVLVVLENFPLNATKVYVKMMGNDYPTILCVKNGWKRYQGKSNRMLWRLTGFGEMFPYDVYRLSFSLYYIEYIIENTTYGLGQDWNYTLNSKGSNAYFYGSRTSILKDSWDISNEALEHRLNIFLFRKGMTFYFQFLLPILIGHLLVLVSTLLERRNLQNRLRIYLSMFVFAPMFSLAIQSFLPYRTTMSFPEFFSVILIISCGIFSFVSLVQTDSVTNPRQRIRLIVFIDLLGLGASYALYYFLRAEVYGHILGKSISFGAFLIFNLYDYMYLVVIIVRVFMSYLDTRRIGRGQTLLDRFIQANS